MSEPNSNLYKILNTLYDTDRELWKKLSSVINSVEAIQQDVDTAHEGVDIYFNNSLKKEGATKLDLAGTVSITTDENDDKLVHIQVGDDLRSALWTKINEKTTNGTVIKNYTASNGLLAGSSVNAIKDSSITFSPNEVIHFDGGDNLWGISAYVDGSLVVSAAINDVVTVTPNGDSATTTFTGGTISGTSTGFTSNISNTGTEANYPSAIGGQGKRDFTFNLNTLNASGKPVYVKIYNSAANATYTSQEVYYVTGVTPAIESASLTIKSSGTKKVSGVEYLSSATLYYAASNITNLNNQLTVGSGNKVTFTALNCSALSNLAYNDFTAPSAVGIGNAQSNTITTLSGNVTLNANLNTTTAKIGATPKNYFGIGTAVSGTLSNVLINTYNTNTETDAKETFVNESKRYVSSTNSAGFNSNTSLSGVGNYTDELQVIPGVGLKYPQTNYSTYTAPAGNPDYSTASGTRWFTRKFIAGSGTVFGGSLTLGGLGSYSTNANFEALLSIDNGTTWYSLKGNRGGDQVTTLNGLTVDGIRTGYASNVISFSFPGTTSMTASDGVIVKIGWTASLKSNVTITQMTLSM